LCLRIRCGCSDVPTCLPSFPTRRSSDLDGLLGTALRHIGEVFPGQLAVFLPDDTGRVAVRRMHPSQLPMDASELAVAHWVYEHRSEEHTSELQSRVDLVCRLRLEKKTS